MIGMPTSEAFSNKASNSNQVLRDHSNSLVRIRNSYQHSPPHQNDSIQIHQEINILHNTVIQEFNDNYNNFETRQMTFEYRIMREAVRKIEKHSQLDLYFFKPKLTAVGIKVRFNGTPSQKWNTGELQLKFIKNLKDIHSGLTKLEEWKKVFLHIDLQIYSKEYILKNPAQFHLNEETPLKHILNSQLQRINKKICQAIIKENLKNKHFRKNQDLEKWVSPQSLLLDIFAVEKSKFKSLGCEKGEFRVAPLYEVHIKQSIWNTQCFEAHSEQQLTKTLIENGVDVSQHENISYPSLLDKIYFK